MIEAFIGVAVGVLTIVLARIIRGQRWLYSLGLLALPSLYAFFALQASEQAVGIKEMIYGVPFVVVGLFFAFVSVRQSAVVVGVFWILHGLYDLTSSQTPVFLVGIPLSVSRLMLLSVHIYYGCRVVSPMQIFAKRKSWLCHSRKSIGAVTSVSSVLRETTGERRGCET